MDLLEDLLSYNSWVKRKPKWIQNYHLNKYFSHQRLNTIDKELLKDFWEKDVKTMVKEIKADLFGFSDLSEDYLYSHLPYRKERKFNSKLKELMIEEERNFNDVENIRRLWLSLLKDNSKVLISKNEYLPKEVQDGVKDFKEEKKDIKVLKMFQWIIEEYESDNPSDFYNDFTKVSKFYKLKMARTAFKLSDVSSIMRFIESDTNNSFSYDEANKTLFFQGNKLHTFKEPKRWKNYREELIRYMFKYHVWLEIKMWQILFDFWEQRSIVNELSEKEIKRIKGYIAKINRIIQEKTKKKNLILLSHAMDWNTGVIIRNY